jgi:hypothetical protein
MDKYWFEAGKGPDPDQAALDREMDEYWSNKNEGGDAVAEQAPEEAKTA